MMDDHPPRNFYYAYIMTSETDRTRHYTGFTETLEERIKAHNSGKVPHTAKYRPWVIECAVAFRSKKKAMDFEAYLKSHSGRAFAKRHF